MNVIKSKYTSEDIFNLYYGSKDVIKKRNVIDLIISIMSFLSFILCFIVLFIIHNNLIHYMNLFFLKITCPPILNQYIFALIKSFAYIGVVLFLPIWVIFKISSKIITIIAKKLYKIYQISPYPCHHNHYFDLFSLYKNMEEFLSYLATDEHPSIILKDQDTVKICIHQQNYAKEYELNFPGMISEIFKDNCIDFSCLDNQVETVFNKKCSDL